MINDLDSQKSYWWSLLSEFGEEILLNRRVSLNLTQDEIAKRCGITQSEISRIERGLATPQNIPTLNNICDAYKLDYGDKSRYAELVTGIKNPQNHSGSNGISQLLKDQIVFVANLNRSGNPKMAIKQAEIIREWLNNKTTRSVILKDKKISNQFLLLLLEESAAWWDISENKDELIKMTKPLLRESFLLDPNSGFYLTNMAFHGYILENYKEAIEIFPKIKDIKTNDGHNWGIELLRIKTIIYAKMGNTDLFEKLEKDIRRQLSNPRIDRVNEAYLLEGLGKAYSILSSKKALSVLKESQELMDSLISNPIFWKIRYVQLIRSYLMATSGKPKERSKILKNVDLALQICDQCGFFRHKKQIMEQLLSS